MRRWVATARGFPNEIPASLCWQSPHGRFSCHVLKSRSMAVFGTIRFVMRQNVKSRASLPLGFRPTNITFCPIINSTCAR